MSTKYLHGFERSELQSLGGKNFKWYAIAITPHILNNTLEKLKRNEGTILWKPLQ